MNKFVITAICYYCCTLSQKAVNQCLVIIASIYFAIYLPRFPNEAKICRKPFLTSEFVLFLCGKTGRACVLWRCLERP